eukprot:TRINITY_DN8628_c0_g1_i1.p1 TRINITY_DN8628_c0_g1~~TRINITY_DN8628_c0_g1_i1.p1  ORF type:complete len:766 (+),score=154.96 TRINITY_DN8628_c0_g1_i1:198-2495(+)
MDRFNLQGDVDRNNQALNQLNWDALRSQLNQQLPAQPNERTASVASSNAISSAAAMQSGYVQSPSSMNTAAMFSAAFASHQPPTAQAVPPSLVTIPPEAEDPSPKPSMTIARPNESPYVLHDQLMESVPEQRRRQQSAIVGSPRPAARSQPVSVSRPPMSAASSTAGRRRNKAQLMAALTQHVSGTPVCNNPTSRVNPPTRPASNTPRSSATRRQSTVTPVPRDDTLGPSGSDRVSVRSAAPALAPRLTASALDSLHQQMTQALMQAKTNPLITETQVLCTPGAVTDVLSTLLLERTDLCDIQFIVGSNRGVILAVSAVMIAHSPAFESMLPVRDVPKGKRMQIALPSVEPNTFAAVVSWCHTGRVVLSLETVHAILAMADQFQLERLAQICRTFASDNINVETALSVLQACYSGRDDVLFNKALAFVCANAEALLKPRKLVESNVSPAVLAVILSQDTLDGVPEIVLYNLIISWGKLVSLQQDSTLISVVAEPLQHVRYGLIDPEQLLAVVKADNLVSSDVLLVAVAHHMHQGPVVDESQVWCRPRTGGALLGTQWDPNLCDAKLELSRQACSLSTTETGSLVYAFSTPIKTNRVVTAELVVEHTPDASWVAVGVTSSTMQDGDLLTSPYVVAISSSAASYGNRQTGSPRPWAAVQTLVLMVDRTAGLVSIIAKPAGSGSHSRSSSVGSSGKYNGNTDDHAAYDHHSDNGKMEGGRPSSQVPNRSDSVVSFIMPHGALRVFVAYQGQPSKVTMLRVKAQSASDS